MRSRETSRREGSSGNEDHTDSGDEPRSAPTMAVSIAGFSTACSKDALVSSAKAAREALSTE